MMITALLIPNLRVTGPLGALATVIALAFVNSKVWDAALFFQLPNSISIQAVSLLLANGAIFWILVKILPGIEVDGVAPALLAPVVFTVTSLLIDHYAQDIDWLKVLEHAIAWLQQMRDYFRESGSVTNVIANENL
ncbi:MAG: phage holin family protein [Bdellovibrionales bacterium]|nr:phage holin family protein [Bdellovibrionales bacterium]